MLIRNVVAVVLACLVAAGAWAVPRALPAADVPGAGAANPTINLPPADKLLKLDDAERRKFETAHPGAARKAVALAPPLAVHNAIQLVRSEPGLSCTPPGEEPVLLGLCRRRGAGMQLADTQRRPP